MKYSTIDTVIVSGGMIQKDFALDFIRSLKEKRKEKRSPAAKLPGCCAFTI